MPYLLLFDGNNVYANAPECHIKLARAVWKVSSYFEYLENRPRGVDITWQPVREDLTVLPRTVTIPWGLVSRQ